MYKLFTVSIVFFVLFTNVKSEFKSFKITKLSNCKAQLDNGKLIDLTSLDNQKSPRSVRDGNYDYKFNPCSPINCVKGTLPTSAVCQVATNGGLSYNCGDQNSVGFDYDGSVFKLIYTSGTRTSIVNCMCGKKESLEFDGEESLTYNLIFTSPCCCPDGCSGKKSGGLSFGSILLIIFFVILFSYFAGGFIFLKFVRKTSGIEVIPNSSFWISLPSDVKSGFSFTVSKIRGNKGGQYSNF